MRISFSNSRKQFKLHGEEHHRVSDPVTLLDRPGSARPAQANTPTHTLRVDGRVIHLRVSLADKDESRIISKVTHTRVDETRTRGRTRVHERF
jgi:hypothetical protein